MVVLLANVVKEPVIGQMDKRQEVYLHRKHHETQHGAYLWGLYVRKTRPWSGL